MGFSQPGKANNMTYIHIYIYVINMINMIYNIISYYHKKSYNIMLSFINIIHYK